MQGTNNTVSTPFPVSSKSVLSNWPVAVSLSLVLLPVITPLSASAGLWLFIIHILFCSYFVFKNQLVKRKQILKFSYLNHTFFNGLLAGLVLWVILGLILNPVLNHFTGIMTNYDKFNVLRHNIPLTLQATAGMWLSAAIGEEIIFRGFLLDRFVQLTNHRGVSVAISSVLFALIHIYQGANGVVTTFVAGVLFGLLYLRSDKNLFLLILAHGIADTLFFASVCFNYDSTFLISRLF
ncbi:MAG: CPBP family intramembrane metalloprotease [Bacteroidia bacterium]|nr:CPBP family intramembrane metalloprotease [Bacteroidia bacterium]